MKKHIIFIIFVVYLIACFLFTLLAGYIGHGATPYKIATFFIMLIVAPLVPYVIVSLVIDTYKQFQWWKILNLIFLIIPIYIFFTRLWR
ncbi:hypothetical protein CIF42_08975 [Campylobacter jejuni]|nr:hypothetical protein [Campylobacter jejuni]MHB71286.1 hypothetical protein [Campylobacter jejuni]OEW94957.1 hypothetical protein A0M36_01835 [Campylobacter jejuni]